MPQIRIEYSNQLKFKNDKIQILSSINKIVADTLELDVDNCKSRFLPLTDYFVGDDPEQKMIHLEIRVFEGKSLSDKDSLGTKLLEILRNEVFPLNENKIQITIQIIDIKTADYFKVAK